MAGSTSFLFNSPTPASTCRLACSLDWRAELFRVCASTAPAPSMSRHERTIRFAGRSRLINDSDTDLRDSIWLSVAGSAGIPARRSVQRHASNDSLSLTLEVLSLSAFALRAHGGQGCP